MHQSEKRVSLLSKVIEERDIRFNGVIAGTPNSPATIVFEVEGKLVFIPMTDKPIHILGNRIKLVRTEESGTVLVVRY